MFIRNFVLILSAFNLIAFSSEQKIFKSLSPISSQETRLALENRADPKAEFDNITTAVAPPVRTNDNISVILSIDFMYCTGVEIEVGFRLYYFYDDNSFKFYDSKSKTFTGTQPSFIKQISMDVDLADIFDGEDYEPDGIRWYMRNIEVYLDGKKADNVLSDKEFETDHPICPVLSAYIEERIGINNVDYDLTDKELEVEVENNGEYKIHIDELEILPQYGIFIPTNAINDEGGTLSADDVDSYYFDGMANKLGTERFKVRVKASDDYDTETEVCDEYEDYEFRSDDLPLDGEVIGESFDVIGNTIIPADATTTALTISWLFSITGINPRDCNITELKIQRKNKQTSNIVTIPASNSLSGNTTDNVSIGEYEYIATATLHSDCQNTSNTLTMNKNVIITKESIPWEEYIEIINLEFSDEHNTTDASAKGFIVKALISNECGKEISDFKTKVEFEEIPNNNIELNLFTIKNSSTVETYKIATIREMPRIHENKKLKVIIYEIENENTNINIENEISFYYAENKKGLPFNTQIDAYWFENRSFLWNDFRDWLIALHITSNLVDAAIIPFYVALTGRNGLCYGFAASSGMYYKDANTKPASVFNLQTVEMDPDNPDVMSYIMKYHIMQLKNINVFNPELNNVYNNIIKVLKSGDPIILGHERTSGKRTNHATTGFKAITVHSDSVGYVFNYENKETTLNKKNLSTCIFNFSDKKYNYIGSDYDKIRTFKLTMPWTISEIINYLRNYFSDYLIKLAEKKYKSFVVAFPGSVLIINDKGERLGYENGQFINEIDSSEVIDVSNDSLIKEKVVIYNVPIYDQYSIKLSCSDSGLIDIEIINPSLRQHKKLIAYDTIPVKKNSTAFLNFSNDTLKMDEDGDGLYEKKYLPRSDGSTFNNNNQTLKYKFSFDFKIVNPSNNNLLIKYEVPYKTDLTIKIYSISGKLIENYAFDNVVPGVNLLRIKKNLPSGEYIIEMVGDMKKKIQQVFFIK